MLYLLAVKTSKVAFFEKQLQVSRMCVVSLFLAVDSVDQSTGCSGQAPSFGCSTVLGIPTEGRGWYGSINLVPFTTNYFKRK